MKLPNAVRAFVPQAKIEGYLLSLSHPKGRDKAHFFIGLGFHPEAPVDLEKALLRIGREEPVVETVSTRFGTKYVVDGSLSGPRGRAYVRTIWITEHLKPDPRLVTAYPVTETDP